MSREHRSTLCGEKKIDICWFCGCVLDTIVLIIGVLKEVLMRAEASLSEIGRACVIPLF